RPHHRLRLPGGQPRRPGGGGGAAHRLHRLPRRRPGVVGAGLPEHRGVGALLAAWSGDEVTRLRTTPIRAWHGAQRTTRCLARRRGIAASVAVGWAGVALAQDVSAEEAVLRSNLGAEVLILIGSVFLPLAAIGVLRFPDFYTRLHASTKLVTLGGIGIFGGSAIAFSADGATARVLLIAV